MLRFLTLMAVLFSVGAHAQDAASTAKLDIELNSIGLRGDNCEVYLRVRNATPVGYDVFKVDLAFFDKAGVINDRSLVELGPLRANKTSLHVFQMPEMECGDVGEVLLNDVTECAPSDGSTVDCLGLVTLSAKGDIAFIR